MHQKLSFAGNTFTMHEEKQELLKEMFGIHFEHHIHMPTANFSFLIIDGCKSV
jgi:hypothetical protein